MSDIHFGDAAIAPRRPQVVSLFKKAQPFTQKPMKKKALAAIQGKGSMGRRSSPNPIANSKFAIAKSSHCIWNEMLDAPLNICELFKTAAAIKRKPMIHDTSFFLPERSVSGKLASFATLGTAFCSSVISDMLFPMQQENRSAKRGLGSASRAQCMVLAV